MSDDEDFFNKSYQEARAVGVIKSSKIACTIMQSGGGIWIHKDGRATIGNGNERAKVLPKATFDLMLS